jgi:hypothetical protein
MSVVVDKRIHIADFRASRLEQLAVSRGLTEDALIEHGLDLLFREQDRQATREEVLREGRELLVKMEEELGPIPASTSAPLPTKEAIFVVGTPIDPERILLLEERR